MKDVFEKLYQEVVAEMNPDDYRELIEALDEKVMKLKEYTTYSELLGDTDYYFWCCEKFGGWF